MTQQFSVLLALYIFREGRQVTKAAKRGRRTETLSLRLDPKDKFALDYIVRITGMPITTVVERAIQHFAKNSLGDAPDWKEFWDISEGKRTIEMLSHKEVRATYEEDELVEFVDRYFDLFHYSYDPYEVELSEIVLHKDRVDVLWPKIHEYVEQWRETKDSNPGAVERVMAEALFAAGVDLPRKWERILSKEKLIVDFELSEDKDLPF